MVLTHPHQDHLAGLVEVLRRYRVKQVLHPNLDDDSPLYDEWRSLIEEKDIKQTVARAGQQIDLGGGVLIRVLNPQTTLLVDTESDIDNNGVVLRLSAGGEQEADTATARLPPPPRNSWRWLTLSSPLSPPAPTISSATPAMRSWGGYNKG